MNWSSQDVSNMYTLIKQDLINNQSNFLDLLRDLDYEDLAGMEELCLCNCYLAIEQFLFKIYEDRETIIKAARLLEIVD